MPTPITRLHYISKKKKNHYVDNEQFYNDLVEFKKAREAAAEAGEIAPRIPEKIGVVLYNISVKRATERNFRNYAFIEEMIGDGYEDCVRRIHNFDPDKGSNPFSYFSQVIFFAFIRRIKAEKKYLYTKFKAIDNANIFDHTTDKQEHDSSVYNDKMEFKDSTEAYMKGFIKDFEEKLK